MRGAAILHRPSGPPLDQPLRLEPAATHLLEQVLASETPALRDALLRSAILERFCPELVAFLCTREPGQDGAVELVEELRRRNLFLIPLDQNGRWFRYHHLFRDLLLRHLHRILRKG